MPTKYEEMCEAARNGRKNRNDYRERCWGCMNQILNGFLAYTETPLNTVTYLRWNGLLGEASTYEAADEGHRYASAGATVLGEDGFWNLGIRIALSAGAIISFVLFVAEQDGKLVAKVGTSGKLYTLDLSNQHTCNELYDDIVAKAKSAFDERRKPEQKLIGFAGQLPPD